MQIFLDTAGDIQCIYSESDQNSIEQSSVSLCGVLRVVMFITGQQCYEYIKGPFNNYVTLFLVNFDPSPPCHKLSRST